MHNLNFSYLILHDILQCEIYSLKLRFSVLMSIVGLIKKITVLCFKVLMCFTLHCIVIVVSVLKNKCIKCLTRKYFEQLILTRRYVVEGYFDNLQIINSDCVCASHYEIKNIELHIKIFTFCF